MPKLNTELLLKVADKLDSLKGKRAMLYDQTVFSTPTACGTAYDICGWAAVICKIHVRYPVPHELVAKRLGVVPWKMPRDWDDVMQPHIFSAYFMRGASPQQVAARLREFAKAGRIRFRKSDFPQ